TRMHTLFPYTTLFRSRQQAIPIAPDETGQSLHDKLAALGGSLLIETLPGYLSGEIQPQPQDDSLATLAPRIQKEEGHIDWTQPRSEEHTSELQSRENL